LYSKAQESDHQNVSGEMIAYLCRDGVVSIGETKLGIRSSPPHHLPSVFIFPPPRNKTSSMLIYLFRKPSDSSILMAIGALDAIFSHQVNP
jgi:hypothetical protein